MRSPRRGGPRLSLERLEDRALPATFTAASVSDLIADVNAANAVGGPNTITLVAGTTFTLTAVDNTTDGATGLPVIAANNDLTIVGNGDVIERSTAKSTPTFRLLNVAAGASLTLQDLTLQGGHAYSYAAAGGAILNAGSLTLTGVTVQYNTAQGHSNVTGGGIYSSGSLTVQASIVRNNQALGDDGTASAPIGGNAAGGGIFIAGGMATLDDVTLSANAAQGGRAPNNPGKLFGGKGLGANGLGGGLYAAGGTVSLHNTTLDHNTAKGGSGPGGAGVGQGGGLYLTAAASVCLDAFTQAHFVRNQASTSDPDVHGPYTTCP
jgi:hypothetical protein